MAVVDIMESFHGWDASVQQETGYGATSDTRARVFTVQFDDIAKLNQSAAITATDGVTTIPAIGEAFDVTEPYIVCTRVYPKITANPYLFEVRCLYAGKDSPLAQPWEYGGGIESSQVEVSADIAGNPYLNPLGDPQFGVQRELVERTIVITRNEANWNNYRDETWLNKINSDIITLFGLARAANTVKLQSVTGHRVVAGTSYYHPVTYMFRIREPKWGLSAAQVWQRRRFLYGAYYWDGSSLDPSTGRKIAVPVTSLGLYNRYAPLQADGQLLPAASAYEFAYSNEFEAVAMSSLGMV